MLYVTTRSAEPVTAQFVLDHPDAPGGGFYYPMTLPRLDRQELDRISAMPYGDRIALVLNLFFPLRVSGTQINGALGDISCAAAWLHHKTAILELWHSQVGGFEAQQQALLRLMHCTPGNAAHWSVIAAAAALLTAAWCQLLAEGKLDLDCHVNLAVHCGGFTAPLAGWICREMGLPFSKIVCACGRNSAPWDLIRRGELRPETATQGSCAESLLLDNLERLIFCTLGRQEARAYATAREQQKTYSLTAEQRERMESFSVSVVSADRVCNFLSRIYETAHYLMSPETALCYNGLQDYRALTGDGTPSLALSEESPASCAAEVLEALNIQSRSPEREIERLSRRTGKVEK